MVASLSNGGPCLRFGLPSREIRTGLLAAGLAFAVVALGAEATVARADNASPTWEKEIRPILKRHCFHCHGEGEKPEGSLDLRLARLTAAGGDSGASIVPGKPDESLLYQRARDGEMPPKDKKLSAAELDLLKRWIADGAKTARPEPADPAAAFITEEERSHRSFQPVRRPALPVVKNATLVRNEIDVFLLAKLESQGLTFSPEAARTTLIRRLSFDLLGLPPSADEVEVFVMDESPDAYERLVDRMLASPHYGERWGRHWLDVAGYADSEGYTDDDVVRADAWKYRDWIVRALNADMPYDRFLIEQIAGDELLTPPFVNLTPEQVETLTATGFLRMAPDGTGGGVDQPLARNQVVADTLQIATSAVLGLTVACAQCHNHRYDPIPQTDYYRLRAVFEPAFNLPAWRAPLGRRVSLYTDADRKRSAEIEVEAKKVLDEREKKMNEAIEATFEKELAKLPEEKREPIRTARKTPEKDRTEEQKTLLKEHPSVNVSAGSLYLYDRKTADELKKMYDDAQAIRATKPVEEFIRAMTEVPGQTPPTAFFYRGDHLQPRQPVSPGELTVLDLHADAPIPTDDASIPTSGRRLAWARRLVDGTHPLTARVAVNRVWMHHFGRGLVATPSDFGLLGERPTHPELLDWLAAWFQGADGAGGEGGRGAGGHRGSGAAFADSNTPAKGNVSSDGTLPTDDQAAARSVPPSPPAPLPPDSRNPWSLKRLHRLLVTSAAYRQTSTRMSALDTVDPDNKLLARMSVRRLEAEAVRDAVLVANGTFNPKLYGKPVPVMQDEVGQIVLGIENLNGENRPDKIIPLNGEEFRRSVYVQVRRSRPLGMLETFDSPQLTPNCESRSASTVATQSLLLMNSAAMREAAANFAERLEREAAGDLTKQVVLGWQHAYGATPTDAERTDAVAFLTRMIERAKNATTTASDGQPAGAAANAKPAGAKPASDPTHGALVTFCQALLSSNRFLYVD